MSLLEDRLFGSPDAAQHIVSAPVTDSFRWATVVQFDPLTIRMDGDSVPLASVPDSVVDPALMDEGSRVWVQIHGRRVIVLGVSQATKVIERGSVADIATIDPKQSWANSGSYVFTGNTLLFAVAIKMDTPIGGNSTGNIGNTRVFTFNPGYRPPIQAPAGSAGSGQMVSYYVNVTGEVYAAATVPNNDLSGTISVAGYIPIGD